jgi:predicted RNase H-like HicB family nuclease
MKNIIQFTIEKNEDGSYTASAVGHFIVTEGDSLEELMDNIKEATDLYLADENLQSLGLVSGRPALLANFEIPQLEYAT